MTGKLTLASVTKGKQIKPYRLVVYGPEGVGKTTFAANAPRPIFLCAEDGTSHLDVARLKPRTFAETLEAIDLLRLETHEYKTVAVDTLDWLEPLIWQHTCSAASPRKTDIEAFGFGKGYVAALDHWRTYLHALETLQREKGMHVVLLAHGVTRDHKDPSIDVPYKRWSLKLRSSDSGNAAGLIREWADALLFARYEQFAVKDGARARGVSSGARLLHTQWSAAFDAKSRLPLPETLPLDWNAFAEAACDVGKLQSAIAELLLALPTDKQASARKAAADAADDAGKLRVVLNRLNATLTPSETNP